MFCVVIVILCGLTESVFDDMERVVDDGVNVFKVFMKDLCMFFVGGVMEIEFVYRFVVYGCK